MQLPDQSRTLTVADGNLFKLGPVTGSRTYTLSDDDARDGDFMKFWTGGGNAGVMAFPITITGADITTSIGTTSNSRWYEFIFLDGEWRRLNFGGE